MQHVARGAAAAHFRDLLAGLDQRALVHQPRAVVPVGRQPLVVVLDDHQFAVTHQTRARVHHHAVGGGAHRLPGLAGDVDALTGGIATRKGGHHGALGWPAPVKVGVGGRCRRGWALLRRCGRLRDHRGPHGRIPPIARIQAQALARIDGVRRRNVVPQREIERGDAVLGGDPVDRLAALDHRGGTVFGLGDAHRRQCGGGTMATTMRVFTHHPAAPAAREHDHRHHQRQHPVSAHATHHAAGPRNSNQLTSAANNNIAAQPRCSIQRCRARSARSPPSRITSASR